MSFLIRSAITIGSIVGARRAAKAVRALDLNDALGIIGLARRSTPLERALPAMGLVALGAVVGAGTALFLAPSSGSEFRTRISGRVGEAKERLGDVADRNLSRAGIGNTSSQATHS
ncbi:MAG TPA: YtxH domain-containing protein [Polyangiaceae bacterium]|nr:YtxH domain-containing protein [Polyangiaceae bacterium]